jgi:MFS family permease
MSLTDPAQPTTSDPAPPSESTPASRWAIPLLGAMAAIQGADPNIASTALVGMSRGLHMAGGLLALAASISTLALSASVISTGLLADRLGRRRVLMAALALAALGDVIAGLAPVPVVFLLGRVLAGVGLGAVFGASFAYIRVVTPPGRIAGAIGVFAAVCGTVTLALTFLGGTLSSIDWRLAFGVIPAATALCIIAVRLVLPAQPPVAGGPADVPGQVLLALGVVGVLYGLSHSATGLTDFLTLAPLVGGLVLLALFFLRESTNPNRFFPVGLFKSPIFMAAICAGFVYNFGTAVGFLQLTNLWQFINGLTTLEVSLWQLPFLVSGIVAALVFGRLMTKGMSNGVAVMVGSASATVGFALLAIGHTSTSLAGFLPGCILVGAGLIITSLPYGGLIMKQAPAKYFGPVTSSRTTIGQFFYAAGLALSTVVVDRITIGGVVGSLNTAGVPPTQTGQALDAVTAFASAGTQPSASLGQQALADAGTSYGTGFATVMIIAAALSLLVGTIGFLLLRRHEHVPAPTPRDAALVPLIPPAVHG